MDAEYHRDYHRNVRRPRLLAVLGDSCANCGATENLEFDHIDPSKKTSEIKSRMSVNNPELAKCQLLCKSCHAVKTSRENSGFTHGTIYAWMQKKCDCAICAKAKRMWHDNRNRRRRVADGKGVYGLPAEHGTEKRYGRGCKCLECKAANAAGGARRRAKQRSDSPTAEATGPNPAQ